MDIKLEILKTRNFITLDELRELQDLRKKNAEEYFKKAKKTSRKVKSGTSRPSRPSKSVPFLTKVRTSNPGLSSKLQALSPENLALLTRVLEETQRVRKNPSGKRD